MPANPVTHPPVELLQSFNLGKLDHATAEKVVRHLKACPTCRQELAALSGDSFLNRLRDAHDRSGTNLPARSLPGNAKGQQAGRTAESLLPGVANLPPELANNLQYHVVRELGRGGMGVVYLAKNVLMDRPEVLKVVNKALLDTPGAAERFLREIRSAAQLSHDNVVKAHSALTLGDLLVFAMEYVEGEDLAKVVKHQGPLPVPRACFYAHQAALGLQHAHEHGMVHRDIKPHNLILSQQGKKQVVKILDFGLAKATREGKADSGLTGPGMVMGTPDYIAPEQAMDAAAADIRADIYSLGCTLYFLLTGAPPFQGKSLMEILQGHLQQEALPLNKVRDDVPAELAAGVAKMMAKEPGQRDQKPIEVAQALAPFVKAGAKPAPAGAVPAEGEGAVKGTRLEQRKPAGAASPWEGMVTEGESSLAKARKPAGGRTALLPAGRPAPKKRRMIGAGIAAGVFGAAVLLLGITLVIKFRWTDESNAGRPETPEGVANQSKPPVAQPTSRPAEKEPTLSVVGAWDGTFSDGAKGVFIFSPDRKVLGDNRFSGRWDQTGRKVIVIDEKPVPGIPAKWEGEIDPTGKKMTLSHDVVGTSGTYVRKQVSTPAEKAAAPSIVGNWNVTFPDGNQGVAQIHEDHTLTTNFGFKATWEQTGHKVTALETNPPPGKRAVVVDGIIDPTGNRINWTSCTYVRR